MCARVCVSNGGGGGEGAVARARVYARVQHGGSGPVNIL